MIKGYNVRCVMINWINFFDWLVKKNMKKKCRLPMVTIL